jgi:uncharacterized protein
MSGSGQTEETLRTKWRELGLGFLNLLAMILVIGAAQVALRAVMPTQGAAVPGLMGLGAYWVGSRWIERRAVPELAPRRFLPEWVAGLALGLGLFAAVMAGLRVAGVYHPEGWGDTVGFGGVVAVGLLSGLLEEIVFRGFLFRLFSKIIGTWGALLVTAALFGAAHAGNRSATVWSSLAIAVEAGILLGAAYGSTQRLWLPIGLHAGWNFCEGSIFGMAVSGNSMRPGLILGTLSGHPILTGGAFGPEASIVAVLLCFALAGFFLWWMVKMKRVEPAAWSHSLKARTVVP